MVFIPSCWRSRFESEESAFGNRLASQQAPIPILDCCSVGLAPAALSREMCSMDSQQYLSRSPPCAGLSLDGGIPHVEHESRLPILVTSDLSYSSDSCRLLH